MVLLEINECISVEIDSTICDQSTEDCQVGIQCHEDIQDVSDISCNVNQFNSCNYQSGPAIASLYECSSITLLEAIAEHLHWFTKHPGTSKQALSEVLYMQHHTILPKGNILPDSYKIAIRIVKSYLVEPTVYDVCPNHCIIYQNHMSDLEKCPKCNTEQFKSNGSIPARMFCYLPLGPCLMRLFGTSNLAKLVQEHGKVSHTSVMHDIHDAPVWKDAYERNGIFGGDSRGISLSLCTDGVNPFSHLRCNYSMWPIMLCLINLPRNIRNNFNNIFLVGIIPANNKREARNIHPYLEVLVDELLSLSNYKIYDAYRQAEVNLKVEILFYVLDYLGVGKLFNLNGAEAYKGCLWCDVKGNIF